MTIPSVDVLVFAPLAPLLGVLLFWFIQLLFIESQKYLLRKIQPNHEPFCRFTNFIGILFQTLCHALGYTVTIRGIASFTISVDYGTVAPKREKKGLGEWVSNAFLFIGPFFIPSTLVLICLFLLGTQGFLVPHLTDYTFAESLIAFGTSLYAFSKAFIYFLATIDFFSPLHIGVLLLIIFLGLGIRPSYIGEHKKGKVTMISDLKNIYMILLGKKRYLLFIIIITYLLFYLSFLLQRNISLWLFSFFGWLSATAIISLVVTHLILLLIQTTDTIVGKKRALPYILLPLSYILFRFVFTVFPIPYFLSVSLFLMLLITSLVVLLLVKYRTNKFKTVSKMKHLKNKDGPRRIIRE
ncbi:MAG: hypothetical protein V1726_07135 [Methanobacteriota archaeon]